MLGALAFLAITICFAPSWFHRISAAYQEALRYSCPMHPEVQSSKPGKCPKCAMKLIAQAEKEPKQQAGIYTCPMHPEVRTNAPGKCPKCAMKLIAAKSLALGEYKLDLECFPAAIRPNQKVKLRFVVIKPETGEPVRQFTIMHEQLFHLFIVSQDMNHFEHIHPQIQPDGSFVIETALPQPGHYKLFCDFYPADGSPQVLQRDLITAGYRSDLFASQARLRPDATLVKTVDGIRIELKLDPAEIIAGKPVTLKYHLTDVKSGAPVRDLKPYLGAWGHTLILSEDLSDYVHSHPSEAVPEVADKTGLGGGPDVTFEAMLPRPGNYRIWTQFLRGEQLTTVSFTVQAVRLH
jgi:hypothetical protein